MDEVEVSGRLIAKRVKDLVYLIPVRFIPDSDEPTAANAYYTLESKDGHRITVHQECGILGFFKEYIRAKIGSNITVKGYIVG